MDILPIFDALNIIVPKEKRKKTESNQPIDFIYTLNSGDNSCCLAVRSKLKYGIQSGIDYVCPFASKKNNHKVTFIDNNYFDYNHEKHLNVVKKFKPEYATTRDVMSEQQCKKENIRYIPLDEILEQAKQIKKFADNVIVIPKYNCLDQIPEEYILGFSIPTSNGGTELLPSAFENRHVHLLGGSWKKQLFFLKQLNVVSIDNNYIHRISNYGKFVMPNGEERQVRSIPGINFVVNPKYLGLILSFEAIKFKVEELNSR